MASGTQPRKRTHTPAGHSNRNSNRNCNGNRHAQRSEERGDEERAIHLKQATHKLAVKQTRRARAALHDLQHRADISPQARRAAKLVDGTLLQGAEALLNRVGGPSYHGQQQPAHVQFHGQQAGHSKPPRPSRPPQGYPKPTKPPKGYPKPSKPPKGYPKPPKPPKGYPKPPKKHNAPPPPPGYPGNSSAYVPPPPPPPPPPPGYPGASASYASPAPQFYHGHHGKQSWTDKVMNKLHDPAFQHHAQQFVKAKAQRYLLSKIHRDSY